MEWSQHYTQRIQLVGSFNVGRLFFNGTQSYNYYVMTLLTEILGCVLDSAQMRGECSPAVSPMSLCLAISLA